MADADQICAQCGWRNTKSARVCGGCGQPLGAIPNNTTSRIPAMSGAASDAPTDYSPEPFVVTERQTPRAPVPTWPSGRSAMTRGAPGVGAASRGLWRAPIIMLLVLAIFAAAGVGAWVFIVRPPIHQQVDSRIHSALDAAIALLPQPPSILPIPASLLPTYSFTYTITAAQADALLQQRLPQNLPISDVHVHFLSGATDITYVVAGQQGEITTHLATINDRLVAQNTTVTGYLGWVESGDEFQHTVNQSLANMPRLYKITAIHANGDSLSISATI